MTTLLLLIGLVALLIFYGLEWLAFEKRTWVTVFIQVVCFIVLIIILIYLSFFN